MEVSVAALMGASILFTVAIVTKKVEMIHLIEKDIEWPTLMFFLFLFIIVGAVDEAGILALIADWILEMSSGVSIYVDQCCHLPGLADGFQTFVIPFCA